MFTKVHSTNDPFPYRKKVPVKMNEPEIYFNPKCFSASSAI